MVDIHRVIGKIPFKPKKGFVLPKHRFTGAYNPLHLQLDSNVTHYRGMSHNAVDAISMRHDICYRDNDTPAGKRECDRKMLAKLNARVELEHVVKNETREILVLLVDKANVARKETKVFKVLLELKAIVVNEVNVV